MKKNSLRNSVLLLPIVLILVSFHTSSCKNESIADLVPPPSISDPIDTIGNSPQIPPTDTVAVNPPKEGTIIKISFISKPNKVSLNPTSLKYGKSAVINLEWDDNSLASIKAYEILKNLNFTDGTGNNKSFTAALAINGLNNYNNKEFGDNYPDKVSYTQMQQLINEGWDIENHGDYHNKTGNYHNGENVLKNINNLTDRLFHHTGYLMNTVVVPSADLGYVKTAKSLGYLGATTQGAKDGFPIFPEYPDILNVSLLPNDFVQLNRFFTDDWTASYVEDKLNPLIDELIAKSSVTTPYLFRLGSHTINNEGFKLFTNHIQKVANDKIWVTSMREFLEYRIVKEKIQTTQYSNKNTVYIVLNYSKIPKNIRFEDISYLIDADAEIEKIEITGATHSSYNKEKKLINIFKEKKEFELPVQ